MVPTRSTRVCPEGRGCSFSGCSGGVHRRNNGRQRRRCGPGVLTSGPDVTEPEIRCQCDRDRDRALCPPKFGPYALTPPGRHAAPDAVSLVLLDSPGKTIQAHGTDRADADRPGPAVRVDGKPQVGLVSSTQRELAPRCRAQGQFVFARGGIWRNQESTRFMTPSISLASPGSGARFRGTSIVGTYQKRYSG
jgi:hypothetical protein